MPTPEAKAALPFLYITDEGGMFPDLKITGTGAGEFSFVWEPGFAYMSMGRERRGAYVRRYKRVEDFEKEQFHIVGKQKRWAVYFGLMLDGEDSTTKSDIVAALEGAVRQLRTEKDDQAADLALLREELAAVIQERDAALKENEAYRDLLDKPTGQLTATETAAVSPAPSPAGLAPKPPANPNDLETPPAPAGN